VANNAGAGGGYPWTVVPLEKRTPFVAALEEASVNQSIGAFTNFLAHLVKERFKGNSVVKMSSSR